MEEFRVIENQEDYQVSNLGNVKSFKYGKERVLKQQNNGRGYLFVNLSKNGKVKKRKVHQLVAEVFLNHKPCGMKLVINHIDNNSVNNNVNNLEVITQRENCMTHREGSSKYKGVSWDKRSNKWKVQIYIDGKGKYLGHFKNEKIASALYESELVKLKNK